MAFHRPISIAEAAAIMGISKSGVVKAIISKRLVSVALNGRGLMLCRDQCEGKRFVEADFQKLCRKYVSVPDACEIVCKTDAMVMRDLRTGRIGGFKLNGRAWAVDRRSAEEEFADYLASPRRRGQPRRVGESRSPRTLRKKKTPCTNSRRR